MSHGEVLLYALGGGAGHAIRACSLASALERHGARATVLLPRERAPLATLLGARARPLPRRREPSELRALVADAVDALRPSLLVVDALPAGVLGELHPLPSLARKTLLLRLHKRLDPEHTQAFDDVIDLEAHLSWRPPAVHASPFAPVARAAAPDAPSVDVALFAGSDEKLHGLFERLASRLGERGLRVVVLEGSPRSPFALEGLAPRVVVGAAGFNLSYEAVHAGAWHVAIPRTRAYDDQRRRAKALAEIAAGPHDLERRVLARVASEARPAVVELASFDELALRVLRGL